MRKLAAQKVDAIYHSPLTRIRQTIQPLLDQRPKGSISTRADPDLRGQCLGELEGGSYDSVDLQNPRSADGKPGVELFDDFVRRFSRSFDRIVAAEAPLVMDCQGARVRPSPSCLPHSTRSMLFLAQKRHIWLPPFLRMVGEPPDQSPKRPSSRTMVAAVLMGPCMPVSCGIQACTA